MHTNPLIAEIEAEHKKDFDQMRAIDYVTHPIVDLLWLYKYSRILPIYLSDTQREQLAKRFDESNDPAAKEYALDVRKWLGKKTPSVPLPSSEWL